MKLIIGLGNPGARYKNSRHNVGFDCIDHMARTWNIEVGERRPKVVLGQGRIARPDFQDSTAVVLAKPRTYMNNSGEGIAYLLSRFAAPPRDMVIIYDEMDLSLGKIRVRPEGSAGGHNGVRSIISTLSTQDFPRVRVGIGKPPPALDGMSYVLSTFPPEEKPVIAEAVTAVADVVACMILEGIEKAMNRYN